MIEQGLIALLTADTAVTSSAAAGGFFAQLPKDQALPAWTYTLISETPLQTLLHRNPLTGTRLQIDCYGATAAEAILLAEAIDAVLDNFKGTLSDPDSTRVQAIFRSNRIDFFDEQHRSYRRLLEYQLWFDRP